MKNISKILLPAAFCIIAGLSYAKEQVKPLPRNISSVTLGISLKEATEKYQIEDVSHHFKNILQNKHLKIYAFSNKFAPSGASGLIGTFYGDKLYRLEATFAPEYTKKISWRKFLKQADYKGHKSETSKMRLENSKQKRIVYTDGLTTITYTRDKHLKPKKIYYYLSVGNIAFSNSCLVK